MTILTPAQRDQLRERISAHKLDAAADLVVDNAAACYSMAAEAPDDYAATGNTRWGGDPDLHPDQAWPSDGDATDNRFSNFLAQINFAELPALPTPTDLPTSGLLSIFVRYMGSAAELVELDAVFYDGPLHALRRVPSPPEEELSDEYLIELEPQRMRAVPAISIAQHRRAFRNQLEAASDDEDAIVTVDDIERSFRAPDHIGQLLGFANAGDVRIDLGRSLYLTQIGKGELVYNDYWLSMEDYEAYIQRYRDAGDEQLVTWYEGMRPGVEWLMEHRDEIAEGVAAWRLLVRINSNNAMGLSINDFDPVYIFIHADDLARRDFSKLVGMVTQG